MSQDNKLLNDNEKETLKSNSIEISKFILRNWMLQSIRQNI